MLAGGGGPRPSPGGDVEAKDSVGPCQAQHDATTSPTKQVVLGHRGGGETWSGSLEPLKPARSSLRPGRWSLTKVPGTWETHRSE